MSSPITYTNSKGVNAVYDPTAEKQKIGVADVKLLVDMGIFPFGKKSDGSPYFNACGGVKRDKTQGVFKKGDTCDKCSLVFGREFAKATHYKTACIEAQKGKVRSHTSKKKKVEAKASPRLQERLNRFTDVFGFYALDKDHKKPNFKKLLPKVKEVCDSVLGKTMVKSVEIVAQNSLIFLGADKQVGQEEPRVVEITLKDWFMKQYQEEGIELYPPKVKVVEDEDLSDGEDDYEDDEEEQAEEEQAEETSGASGTEEEEATTEGSGSEAE